MRTLGERIIWSSLVLVLALGTSACGAMRSPNERFTLAWRDQGQAVQVRFSTDGTMWATATFPQVNTAVGPGAAADPDGITFLVAAPTPGGTRLGVFGIGPDTYSSSVDVLGSAALGPMDSAPSLAYAGGAKWLFAFREQSSAKVMSYDSGPKTWTDVTPTLNVSNTFVEGRPAIAVKGTRVVLTWFRNVPNAFTELQVAVGNVDSRGNVTWLGGFPFPNTASGFGGVLQRHGLAHDHTSFLLGALRPDSAPSGPLQTNTLFVYASTDGMSWSERTRLGAATPPNLSVRDAPLSIAAHSNGTIVVADNPNGGPRMFRFDGSAWSLLPSGAFTGSPEPLTDFALIGSGRP